VSQRAGRFAKEKIIFPFSVLGIRSPESQDPNLRATPPTLSLPPPKKKQTKPNVFT